VFRRVTVAAIGVLALAGAGCGTSASERDARRSVERFYSAFEARDGAGACRELSQDAASALESSEREPCERAVLSLRLTPSPTRDASVWVTSAQVKLSSGVAAFLDQVGGRWRISAAGCRPSPGEPYDCELEG
jgi:hypothetical protein